MGTDKGASKPPLSAFQGKWEALSLAPISPSLSLSPSPLSPSLSFEEFDMKAGQRIVLCVDV